MANVSQHDWHMQTEIFQQRCFQTDRSVQSYIACLGEADPGCTDLREKPVQAAARMPKESPADVKHHVQASPSNFVSSTYLKYIQPCKSIVLHVDM